MKSQFARTSPARPGARFAASIAILPLIFLSSANAQTASQLTEDNYAPPVIREAEGGGLLLPEVPGLDAPDGADTLEVTPSGLVVEGALPELAEQTAAIEARIKNKRVTGADLFAAARELEASYARAGYILSRVSLPPQTIHDGMPLKLVVTNGYIASIEVSALPQSVRNHVRAVLAPLIGKQGLKKQELERRLLLAGDTPGVSLRSTLKAGDELGAAVIIVEGRYDRVGLTATLLNSLSDDLGSYSVGLGADANNLLGLGDVGYLRLAGHPNRAFTGEARNRQIVAGTTLPLGHNGAWLNIEAVDSQTNPSSDLSYSLSGRYQRASAQIGYHWLRSRNANLSTRVSFDVANEKQTVRFASTNIPFSEDRLRVLRITEAGNMFDPWGGQLAGSLTASFGLDALGARKASTPLPMSRDGAKPTFQKVEALMQYANTLADDNIQMLLTTRGQLAFGHALSASEQFALSGADQLSSLKFGEIQADTGLTARAEFAAPQILNPIRKRASIGEVVTPYVFSAAGVAVLEKPTALEPETAEAASYGTGVHIGLSERASANAVTLSLEYARSIGNEYDLGDNLRIQLRTHF